MLRSFSTTANDCLADIRRSANIEHLRTAEEGLRLIADQKLVQPGLRSPLDLQLNNIQLAVERAAALREMTTVPGLVGTCAGYDIFLQSTPVFGLQDGRIAEVVVAISDRTISLCVFSSMLAAQIVSNAEVKESSSRDFVDLVLEMTEPFGLIYGAEHDDKEVADVEAILIRRSRHISPFELSGPVDKGMAAQLIVLYYFFLLAHEHGHLVNGDLGVRPRADDAGGTQNPEVGMAKAVYQREHDADLVAAALTSGMAPSFAGEFPGSLPVYAVDTLLSVMVFLENVHVLHMAMPLPRLSESLFPDFSRSVVLSGRWARHPPAHIRRDCIRRWFASGRALLAPDARRRVEASLDYGAQFQTYLSSLLDKHGDYIRSKQRENLAAHGTISNAPFGQRPERKL